MINRKKKQTLLILTGIPVLPPQPFDFLGPQAAPASSPGPADDRDRLQQQVRWVRAFRPLAQADSPVFGTDSLHTAPYLAASSGDCARNPTTSYPAGDGSPAIFRRMPPKSRRVRGLSASSSQQERACSIKRPPVFTSRYCKLLSDQLSIRAGSTSRGHRFRRF